MSAIAIITARGGSKRIPKKNIKKFCGQPIIAYSIEAAIKSKCFDTVMVSTDSEEIAEVAKQYGAEVPFFRSASASDDFATTADVVFEVLDKYREMNVTFDLMCCIYPTAPFLTADKINSAIDILKAENADTVMPVVSFSFPPQRGNVIREGRLKYLYPEYSLARSQDLETIYHDCGQFYLCKVQSFINNKKFVSENTVPFILKEEEVQDIDNESDWILAEAKYRAFISKENN